MSPSRSENMAPTASLCRGRPDSGLRAASASLSSRLFAQVLHGFPLRGRSVSRDPFPGIFQTLFIVSDAGKHVTVLYRGFWFDLESPNLCARRNLPASRAGRMADCAKAHSGHQCLPSAVPCPLQAEVHDPIASLVRCAI